MGTTPKKTPIVKKTTAAKKVVASKAVPTKKVVTKNSAAKKVATKKVVAKKTTKTTKVKKEVENTNIKTPYSRKVLKLPKTKAKKVEDEKVVEIPNSPSLRLLEKVEIYKAWYQEEFPGLMLNAARIGGYLFIASGVMFASYGFLSNTAVFSNSAAIVCTEVSCKDIPDAELPAGAPLVTFLNQLPPEVIENVDFSIKVNNTTKVDTYLTAINSGKKLLLVPNSDSDAVNLSYSIAFSTIEAGVYKITSEVTDGNTIYKFAGPDFVVNLPEEVAPVVVEEVQLPEVELVTKEVDAEENEVEDVQESLEEDEPESDTEEISNEEETVQETTSDLSVSLELKNLSDSTYLKVKTGTYTPNRVEIYSEAEDSGHSIFLGQATLVQSDWVFSLSAIDLPNYNHVIYASFLDKDNSYKTEGVTYTPKGQVFGNGVVSADSSLLVQKVNLAFQSETFDNTSRQEYFTSMEVETGNFFSDEEVEFASAGLISKINSTMLEHENELNALLSNYATAVQGGVDFVIRLAEAQLEASADRIANEVKSYTGEANTLPNIKSILALRFKDMQSVVSDAERNVSIKSNSLTSRDSDSDGVSNYDEVINFNTNPDLVDTDNDGVIDSVEVINLTNPGESDIVNSLVLGQSFDDVFRTETISIDRVDPLITTNSRTKAEERYVVVKGKAIPNSFVNIITEGSSVVGIIKTGATGDFAYTLERELPRGKNQLSLALVNNDGDIITLSKPFNFSNTANALSAAAADSSAMSLQKITDSVRTKPEIVTASVGVVAFGLILLLLSQTLRNRRKIVKEALA